MRKSVAYCAWSPEMFQLIAKQFCVQTNFKSKNYMLNRGKIPKELCNYETKTFGGKYNVKTILTRSG